MKRKPETFLFIIILFSGACLRLYNLGGFSYSNDELSALTRARFDTFHELVEKGIKVDGHPALAQTIIWFTIHHFNDNEFTVRLPFALSGIISILLIFLLAKRWFGSATGLLSAAALATLQFPVLYSQIARPYSLGLMFSLALAYSWTRLLFDEKKNNWIIAGYIISSTGCIYSHYFSFMLAGFIGISGLFFIKKENVVRYLVISLIPVILFIPSISIFKQQIGYEGIGGWLDAPDAGFLPRYLYYIFNNSQLVVLVLLSLFLISLKRFRGNNSRSKFHSLAVAWFFLPFITGYLYSAWIAPVMQYSTLLFSFPFILIFLFSFISEEWISKKIIIVMTILVFTSCAYSTVIENKYFQVNHFGVFRELAEKTKEWDDKYGNANSVKLFSVNNPEYLNYYFRRLNHDPSMSIYSDDERTRFGNLNAILDTTKATYFIYAWSNALHAYETPQFIKENFPVLLERDTFFNSEISLYKRGNPVNDLKIITQTSFENNSWNNEEEVRNNDVSHTGSYSQKMTDKIEFGTGFHKEKSTLNLNSNDMLKAECWFYSSDSVRNAQLVIAFSKKENNVQYASVQLKNFYFANKKWTKVFLYSEIPKEDCELNVYVWNPGHETFYVDDISIATEPGSLMFRK